MALQLGDTAPDFEADTTGGGSASTSGSATHNIKTGLTKNPFC